MSRQVVITAKVDGGNRRAGAKSWGKVLTAIDPSKGNGYGLIGDWLPDADRFGKGDQRTLSAALPEGTLVVLGGRGGSHKNTTDAYVLCRVEVNASFRHSAGYQSFSGDGLALLATSGDDIDSQATLDKYPTLAPVGGSKLLAIYAAAHGHLSGGEPEAANYDLSYVPTEALLAELSRRNVSA
jgi:hypothetical protein